MLGSMSFDGFARTSTWQNVLGNVRADLAGSSLRVVDLATTLVNAAGLAAFVAGVVVTYLTAVWAARALVRVERSLVPDVVRSLVPIAAAYLVAHYFSLFLIQGQFVLTLASDPFGKGWDLFGTADFAPNLAIVSGWRPVAPVTGLTSSRDPLGRDEAGVEQDRGNGDGRRERSDADPGEPATDCRNPDAGKDEGVAERA